MKKRTRFLTALILTGLLSLMGLLFLSALPLNAAETDPVKKGEIERGRAIYQSACMNCHGIKGNGNGPAAKWLDPRPRDFTKAFFRWRTTGYGQLPTDDDLARTIREGASGTEMFPFKNIISTQGIKALVSYIKTFSPNFSNPALQPKPESIVKIPAERPFKSSADSIAKGKALYTSKGCFACHGVSGAGDGPAAAVLKNMEGYPLRPWDFTKGYFKSGDRDQDIYRTITTGLNGTPMPTFGPMTSEEERWNIVDFLRSLGPSSRSMFSDNPSGKFYDNE